MGQPARMMGPLPSVLPLVKPETDPRMREGEGIPPTGHRATPRGGPQGAPGALQTSLILHSAAGPGAPRCQSGPGTSVT